MIILEISFNFLISYRVIFYNSKLFEMCLITNSVDYLRRFIYLVPIFYFLISWSSLISTNFQNRFHHQSYIYQEFGFSEDYFILKMSKLLQPLIAIYRFLLILDSTTTANKFYHHRQRTFELFPLEKLDKSSPSETGYALIKFNCNENRSRERSSNLWMLDFH